MQRQCRAEAMPSDCPLSTPFSSRNGTLSACLRHRFLTGDLIKRFGVLIILMMGTSLMFGCTANVLSGVTSMHSWWVLVLLCERWNFLFIGGTTLLRETYLRWGFHQFCRRTYSQCPDRQHMQYQRQRHHPTRNERERKCTDGHIGHFRREQFEWSW